MLMLMCGTLLFLASFASYRRRCCITSLLDHHPIHSDLPMEPVRRTIFRKVFDYHGPLAWYPGHMAKAQRIMGERLSRVDLVIEVRDARVPYSSANTFLGAVLARKAKVVVYNKADLANPNLFSVCTSD